MKADAIIYNDGDELITNKQSDTFAFNNYIFNGTVEINHQRYIYRAFTPYVANYLSKHLGNKSPTELTISYEMLDDNQIEITGFN